MRNASVKNRCIFRLYIYGRAIHARLVWYLNISGTEMYMSRQNKLLVSYAEMYKQFLLVIDICAAVHAQFGQDLSPTSMKYH